MDGTDGIHGWVNFRVATEGQVNDAAIVSNPRVTLTFCRIYRVGVIGRVPLTGSVSVRTNDDADAEIARAVLIHGGPD